MDEKLIQLQGVTKRFGKNTVFDSIDLDIPEGKITGIIGASGEGKSTMLKMIASFYKPTSGKILYSNKDIFKEIKNIKRLFGFAIEDGSFYEDLTVKENLLYFGRLYHVKKSMLLPRIEGLMHFVSLINAKDVLAKNLSLGMKKRLGIACSLVHKPSVLILDEPTADLDPLLRFQIIKLIKKINYHGTTIVFTTQILNEADEICDKIVILYNEKIIDQTSSSKIKTKYNSSDLDEVFRKIFSKKGRKTYQESVKKKTILKDGILEVENNLPLKKGFLEEQDGELKIAKKGIEEVFLSNKIKKFEFLKKIKNKFFPEMKNSKKKK